MTHPPATDDPDYLDRETTKTLARLSEDPGDVRRLLLGLADVLGLTAARIPPAEKGNRRLVWEEDEPSAKRPEENE